MAAHSVWPSFEARPEEGRAPQDDGLLLGVVGLIRRSASMSGGVCCQPTGRAMSTIPGWSSSSGGIDPDFASLHPGYLAGSIMDLLCLIRKVVVEISGADSRSYRRRALPRDST